LGATLLARAITDDMDGLGAPTTALGQQHHAWERERGLALTPHRTQDQNRSSTFQPIER